MTDTVLFQELPTASGHVIGRATLNAPAALNALSLDMIESLSRRLDDWQDRDDIVAIWLEGAGDKAFCAGGDVVALHRAMVRHAGKDRNPEVEAYFAAEYRLDHRLHRSPVPVICWADGLVLGGGMGLMQGSTFRLVTANSRLGMPEINIGLYPDVGASWFLNRLPGRTGLFLGLTGVHFDARDALNLGLADRCLDQDAEHLLDDLGGQSFTGERAADHALLFRFFRDAAHYPLQLDGAVSARRNLIDNWCDGADLPEVVDTLLAAKECDSWLDKARANLTGGCPQTAFLVWEQLRRARYLSLEDVFRMEWTLSVQCALHADFREGVRALLIDKDGKPRFRHRSVHEVPPGYIDTFFENLAPRHPLADLGS